MPTSLAGPRLTASADAPRARPAGGRLARTVLAAVDLAAPSACPGCDAPGRGLCPDCRSCLDAGWFAGGPRVVRLLHLAGRVGGAPVPCVAAGPYDGVARTLLREGKDGARRDALAWLVPGLVAALLRAEPLHGPRAGPLVLVPAPSARRAERRRGDRPLVTMARQAARCAAPDLVGGAVVLPALRTVRAVADQSHLGRAERARNVAAAFAVRHRAVGALRALGSSGASVAVVDDVLTTGATAAECVRALSAEGVTPRAVVTVLVAER